MIFRVYEHYDDTSINDLCCIKPDECFVCYELSTETELTTISLNSQTNYNKLCRCDGWIHNKCLDKWIKNQKKCPICRHEITKRNNDIVYVAVPHSNSIYVFIRKSASRAYTILVYLFLTYLLIEFYVSIFLTKHILREKRNVSRMIA